jgi:hypothetical protein
MLYQLPNGRVIEISTEQYFEMSDEQLEYLIASNYGEVLENPWFGSVLSKKDNSVESPEELDDLIDVPVKNKLTDLDVDYDLAEE